MFREEELLERAKALKVNVGSDPGADVGPVISKEVKTYLQDCFKINLHFQRGVKLLVDFFATKIFCGSINMSPQLD